MKNNVTADLHQTARNLARHHSETMAQLEDIKAFIQAKFSPAAGTENDTISPDSILAYLWSLYWTKNRIIRREIGQIEQVAGQLQEATR